MYGIFGLGGIDGIGRKALHRYYRFGSSIQVQITLNSRELMPYPAIENKAAWNQYRLTARRTSWWVWRSLD